MKILSLNVWGGRLHDPLMLYLETCGADVLCLQEVVRTPGCDAPWLTYRDGDIVLPQRARLFDEIRAALPSHDAVFCPSARGDLHDADGTGVPSLFGIATFVRDTIPVIGQAQGFVHGDFAASGFGAHPRSRNAHGLRLHDDQTGAALTVVQIHGLRDPAGKHDTPARERQAEALSDLIGRVHRPTDRLVVCGDFNLLPDSATFDRLEAMGLTDLVTTRGHTDTRTSHYGKPGRFADYMLASANAAILSFEVVAAPEVSDHRALILDLA